MKETFYKNIECFLNQKYTKPFRNKLTNHSLTQVKKIIKVFNTYYLRNLRKEMIVNLLKYNVGGCWVKRLKDSEKYKKMSCSLEACIVRYGKKYGKLIYDEHIKTVITKKENYTTEEWDSLCKRKISNLGLDGYIKKYGELEGTIRWSNYLTKWKQSRQDRLKSGGWKSGNTLPEYQEKYGKDIGYDKWKHKIDKRNYTLSMSGFVDRYGELEGKKRYFLYVGKMVSNCRKGKPYSDISQELFDGIYKKLDSNKIKTVKYFTLNEEQPFYCNGLYGLNIIYVDFKCGKSIIEFDGDYWHSSPDIIQKDKNKTLYLEQNGYNVLRIKEKDYRKNKTKIIQDCVKFINKNYE